MSSNKIVASIAKFVLFVVLYFNISYAHSSNYYNESTIANEKSNNNGNGNSHLIPHFSLRNGQLQKHEQLVNQKQQQRKYPPQRLNLTNITATKTASSGTLLPSTTSTKPYIQPAYVYKAVVPTHIEPEANKLLNSVKLASASSSSSPALSSPLASPFAAQTSYTSNTSSFSNINSEKDDELSKKIIGSSVVTSVSVVLNGDEPEFTDALGQKVPKPQQSLQVASPIDLLNPDRYEFYTFDENGELVKRLMTMEEIQSIVANGDGEGPTIIHHGPIEDRDPEKNVQDIVNSVQSVLIKEVESSKNTSTEILPVFDTPDVSSSWSMILPAIFGNTGNVDIFPHQKPQQIVMTPDTEIIELSTTESATTTTKKPKPNKRKPGQKRKPTTTTQMTPQVIQEELDSQESVYTGMLQYQNLAASMQNYDGFTQLNMQPIYHKLPEIEASTRRVFINNEEVVKGPITHTENTTVVFNENLAKKPVSVQNTPLPPHRLKKPNGSHITTKRPQTSKHKIKRKPTTSAAPTATSPFTTTSITALVATTASVPPVQTSAKIAATEPTSTTTDNISPSPGKTTTIVATATTTKSQKTKKKKPTLHPVFSSSTGASTEKVQSAGEKEKPINPHKEYTHISSDLAAEGTAHQDISHNQFQQVLHHKTRPALSKPLYSTFNSTTTTNKIPSTLTIPTTTTSNPTDVSPTMKDFPGYQQTISEYPAIVHTTRITTSEPLLTTSGTSGYPVPSYGISTDESEALHFNQHIKQPVLALQPPQHGSMSYDEHTVQSFDQIMQTLKQPEQMTERISENITNVSEKLNLLPIKYDSAENEDQLEIMANKHMLPLQNHIKMKPTYESLEESSVPADLINIKDGEIKTLDLTVRPQPAGMNKSTEKATNEHSEATNFPSFLSLKNNISDLSTPTVLPEKLHLLSEKQVEKNTEHSTTKQNIEDYTQETNPYDSTSYIFDQTTLSYENENITDGNIGTEDHKEHTVIETNPPNLLPNKEATLVNNENYASSPVFVANLKTQLNMEVIKPSEQISMSDFQTQAATVASTLVDGTNTMSAEYSETTSNETKDEIAFLMSDVIHQISSMNISKTQQTNSNDNRFSNQAQLDLSFLMSPTQIKPNNTAFIIEDQSKPDYKQQSENLEGIQILKHQNGSLHTNSSTYFETTELPESTSQVKTQNQDYDIEFIDTTTQTYAQNEVEHLITTVSTGSLDSVEESLATTKIRHEPIPTAAGYNKESFIAEVDQKDYSGSYNIKTTFKSETTTENNEEKAALTLPSILQIYSQQQKLENDREPLFEVDSSMDSTTLNTIVLNMKEQSSIANQEISNNEKTKWSEHVTENKGVGETSSSELQSDLTTLKSVSEVNDKLSTEFLSETSEENVNLVDSESTTTTIEVAEGLKNFYYMEQKTDNPTLINRESLPNKQSESESNAINISSDSVINSSQKDETTTQLTSDIEIDTSDGTTPNIEESQETTTTIYQMSEETSAELNAMISEEDETVEYVGEDPYIKLGETTTLKPETSLETVIQTIAEDNLTNQKPDIGQDVPMLSPPKPNNSVISINSMVNYGQQYDEPDAEDEEDQFGYHEIKLQNATFTATNSTTTVNKLTSTPKPELSTTRRLNTLKPVSYYNKQPAYALYQEPVEVLYNKKNPPPSLAYEKENTPPKVVAFTIPNPQQRPMQRPPQLSNLLISSTQATRPPVKLESSPNNSKGLEASLENLDGDILAFSTLCNELAFSYWKSITSEKISFARSLVISPFALTSMLSMIFLGARGGTSGEMNDVLKLDDMVTFNPHLVFKNITDSVEKSMDSNIATTAFVREIYSDRANGKVLQFFKEKTHQLYAGHVEEVNFHVVNDIIRRRTNLLVKRHTMGKVLEYLRTNSVWVNGPLATISANLFQTNCSFGSTQDRDGELFFQVHPTIRQRRLVPIPAVLFKSGFTAGYEPKLDATVVAFGRLQDTTSMLYIMPGHLSSMSPSDNLDRLERQLVETAFSQKAWTSLLSSLMDRPGMEVQIPRFSHRSFVNATLGLQKMGLKGLFKSDYADLGGLTGSSNRDIYLSDFIQINTFSTCGEEKIADHHHVEMYPAPPLRKRNKNVDARDDDEQDSSEAIIDFGSLVQDSMLGRGFYDDLLDPKYLELPLPLRPRQARVPDTPRLKLDKPFLYFVRHNPTGMILFMGRFNPRLLP